MNPQARVRLLAREARRNAQKHGYRLGSHQFASYVRGQFVVASREHPEIEPFKVDFLKLVGVIA